MKLIIAIKADSPEDIYKRLAAAVEEIKTKKQEKGECSWEDGYYEYLYERRFKT